VTPTSFPDDATAIEVAMLREHLCYELDMLEGAFIFLHDDSHAEARKNKIVRNAMVEAFWTHARNLLEFLAYPKREGATGIASARNFTDQEFVHQLTMKESIDDEVNIQISHLQYERKSSPQEKLGGYDMAWVKAAIDSHIKRFEKHLLPRYQPFWVTRTPSAPPHFDGEARNTTTIESRSSTPITKW
jgi:hypothetical protein